MYSDIALLVDTKLAFSMCRYKNKTEKALRSIVESFRCYADGLNFSADLKKEDFN